jgi:aminoglycoside 6'-N-acetyltransferase I
MAEVAVRLLGPADLPLLLAAEPDVFDNPVAPALAAAFLADPRHHIIAAVAEGKVVGFASAFDYLHPDKPRTLFIAEAGVASRLQRRGIGLRLIRAMLDRARALGCSEAWISTEVDNHAARALYGIAGGVPDTPNAEIFVFQLAPASGEGETDDGLARG